MLLLPLPVCHDLVVSCLLDGLCRPLLQFPKSVRLYGPVNLSSQNLSLLMQSFSLWRVSCLIYGKVVVTINYILAQFQIINYFSEYLHSVFSAAPSQGLLPFSKEIINSHGKLMP